MFLEREREKAGGKAATPHSVCVWGKQHLGESSIWGKQPLHRIWCRLSPEPSLHSHSAPSFQHTSPFLVIYFTIKSCFARKSPTKSPESSDDAGRTQWGWDVNPGKAAVGCGDSDLNSALTKGTAFFFLFFFHFFFLSTLTISGKKVTSKNECCGFATLH